MDFEKLIQTRQSCRDFDGRAVERELIVKCIEAGRLAPSAANAQPWRLWRWTTRSSKGMW